MGKNVPDLKELSANQQRVYIDTTQVYEAMQGAVKKAGEYKGGMHWKKSKGKEYLFRTLDRHGRGKSLGPRSEATEKILEDFRRGKEDAKERLSSLRDRLKEQARFCKAAGIQRVPTVVAKILGILEKRGVMGRGLIVVGTNALYAYEAAAGVAFDVSITTTEDMDILWDTRSRLMLAADDEPDNIGLLDILKKADSSFSLVQAGSFRAANKKGYLVDLIKPMPESIWKPVSRSIGGPDDLQAADVRNIDWLISAPKFSRVVIGRDGHPAEMVVPDPRAFAAHKLWLSTQDDRNAVKKQRDRTQALAVAELVKRYLPQHRFAISALRMFPKDVVAAALKTIKDQ